MTNVIGVSAARRLLELEENPTLFFEFVKAIILQANIKDVEETARELENLLNTQWGSNYTVCLCLADDQSPIDYHEITSDDEITWHIDRTDDIDPLRTRH